MAVRAQFENSNEYGTPREFYIVTFVYAALVFKMGLYIYIYIYMEYVTDGILQGRCFCDSHQLIRPRGYRCVGELLQVLIEPIRLFFLESLQ